MTKKIISLLFSTRLMAILFIAFASAMAAGTFIEDAYNTETARIIIYNAWWFEAIMALFLINFFGNIKRYQLYKKEKWATLLLHLAFVFIIIGAFITRYISYEGVMPIREGETSNTVFSDMPYVTTFVDGEYKGEMKRKTLEKQALFSKATSNHFHIKDQFDQTPYEIKLREYVMNAKTQLIPTSSGKLYLKLVEASQGKRKEHFICEGEVKSINNLLFTFNKATPGAINISKISEAYTIQSPSNGSFMRMADKFSGTVTANKPEPLFFRSLYNISGIQFVLPEMAQKGDLKLMSDDNYKDKVTDDAIIIDVTANNKTETITLFGSKGKQSEPKSFKLGNLDFTFFYGSKIHQLPFQVKLNDFIADKYPGSDKSFSAFKSKLEIKDIEAKKTFQDSVFMNHILDYKGYRLFQASFDPDEKGTVLSVNHDFWGTWITYLGYFILYLGLMAILFDKNTRFGDLKKKLEKIRAKKALSIFILFFSSINFAQNHEQHQNVAPKIPSYDESITIIRKNIIPIEHAAKFGKIVIQDFGGRMKPINTFSSELLRKISKNDSFENFSSDQVLLSMTQYPQYWYQVPIINVKKANDSIRKLLSVKEGQKYLALINFFDEMGNYKIANQVDEAYKATVPNQFQKDFIETDKKVNLLYSALSGQILRVFPLPKDKNNKWVSFLEISHKTNTPLDIVKNVLPFYLNELSKPEKERNYKMANQLLDGLTEYQKKFGKKVMLSDEKIETEILYNKYDIFKKLFSWYLFAGLLMFIFVIWKIFSNKKWLSIAVKTSHIIIALLFVSHLLGLLTRWYISGHAPWSDAYESMIYVAWATLFFGLAFGRKSELTVASTTFVTSIILMVAHWNWMDPSIANLQPVLNSYWLMIHVAVIVASYGPFTLGMILGLVSLFMMIFTTEKNYKKMNLTVSELTIITEMALTVGLVMLTIGNFLGGQWANESWGRYWGWDPKETWALISIMIYAFVIHARFVPSLRGKWVFNFMSVLAFASILMTYFGVNFHLSGMHSYASGEKQNVTYYFYALAVVLFISLIAYFKYRKFYKK